MNRLKWRQNTPRPKAIVGTREINIGDVFEDPVNHTRWRVTKIHPGPVELYTIVCSGVGFSEKVNSQYQLEGYIRI